MRTRETIVGNWGSSKRNKLAYGAFRAPSGGWTVGSLVDAIAKGQPGYGDHCFFEGMSGHNGYYSVMYGS